MLNLFVVFFTVVAILVAVVAVAFIPRRPVGLSVGALVWALYRTLFVSVHWAFVRPLDFEWTIVVGVLLVGAWALYAFHRAEKAPWLGRAAVVVAVFAPFLDMFGAPFWGDWTHEHPLVIGGMIAVLAAIGLILWGSTIKAVKALGAIVAIIALVMVGVWIKFGLTGNAGPIVSPTPTTTSASPTPTPGATPAATPSATATTSSSTPTLPAVSAAKGSVASWADMLYTVGKANATTDWLRVVDNHQDALRFNSGNVRDWATTKLPDGTYPNTRYVVVFGASASDITDDRARELAGVPATVPVTRATACFVAVANDAQVCPTGDSRVMMFVAPIGHEGDKLVIKEGSGIALVPSTDGKQVTLAPATYTVAP